MHRYRMLTVAALFFFLFHCAANAGDKDGGIVVDKDKRTVTIDAKIAPRKLAHLKGEIYPVFRKFDLIHFIKTPARMATAKQMNWIRYLV